LEPPLCVVSSWVIKRIYITFIFNTISGFSNLDICFYYCLILTLISHLKILFNSSSSSSSSSFFIIYIVNLSVVRPRFCQVIYYFDTPTFRIRYQSFDRVTIQSSLHFFKLQLINHKYYLFLLLLNRIVFLKVVWTFFLYFFTNKHAASKW